MPRVQRGIAAKLSKRCADRGIPVRQLEELFQQAMQEQSQDPLGWLVDPLTAMAARQLGWITGPLAFLKSGVNVIQCAICPLPCAHGFGFHSSSRLHM
jgi:hypothetical protein